MKTVDCRFTENNYFLGSGKKESAICIETNNMEFARDVKRLLHDRLRFKSGLKEVDYEELEGICKSLRELEKAIELFESFEKKQQEEKETEEEERKECAGTISDID